MSDYLSHPKLILLHPLWGPLAFLVLIALLLVGVFAMAGIRP